MNDITQFEKDLIHLWENFQCEPTYMQMQLGQLRKLQNTRGDAQDYMVQFLEDTRDLPDDAIAVLTPGKATILTDEDGNLLAFN